MRCVDVAAFSSVYQRFGSCARICDISGVPHGDVVLAVSVAIVLTSNAQADVRNDLGPNVSITQCMTNE